MMEFIGKNGVLFKYTGGEKTVRIPEEYKIIGYHAFYETDPEIIIIPETVMKIDTNGLDFDSGHGGNLKEIHIEGDNVELNDWSLPNIHKYKLFVRRDMFSKLPAYAKWMIGMTFLEEGTLTTDEKILIKYINAKTNFENYLKVFLKTDNAEAVSRLVKGKRIKPEDNDTYVSWASENKAVNCKLALVENTVEKAQAKRKEDLIKGKSLADYRKEFKLSNVGDYYCVSSYRGTDSVVTVPCEINGKTVIAVGDHAFNDLQNGITDEMASFRKNQLEEVIVEEGIETIGTFAFSGCQNLKRVVLPKSMKAIERRAFYECPSLSDINVEDNVYLEEGCFSRCPKLPKDSTGLMIFNHQLFDYYGDNETVVIPEGIKRIGNTIFAHNKTVKQVVLPSTVEVIDAYAFTECESLQSIIVPQSVEKIESGTFMSCQSLNKVEIGEKVQTIERWAFSNCRQLEKVVFHGNAKIDKDAILNCHKMIVYAPKGSNVIRFAKKNSISYVEE